MEDQPTIRKKSIFEGASPQLMLLFGLMTGLVAVLLVGAFIVVPRAFNAASRSTGSSTATAASDTTAGTAAAQPQAAAQPSAAAGSGTAAAANVKPVSKDDHVRGAKNPKVYLVEYSDAECPFCKRFHPTMQQALKEYGDKVAWVYRHFPLSFHANASKEAEASECANELGGSEKFWEYTDKIFERTTSNGTGFALDALVPLAKEIGLNESKFKSCLDSGKYAAHVNQDVTEGTSSGVNGTPTTFIVTADGKTLTSFPGALPYEQIKPGIDQALSKS